LPNFGRSKKSDFLNSDTKTITVMKTSLLILPLACAACLFTGCAAVTRTATDVGLGAGGAALGGELTHNNPYAIVGGAAGGALLGEGLHAANGKLNDASYQTGYDKGRSDAVKQQYWLYVSMQQAKAGDNGHVRLYEVHLPEQVIDGVIFQPTTQFIRIEE
jgi:ADP-ribosylglycohydrolase